VVSKQALALGIVPEKPIQVLRKAGFGGPLHVRVGVTTEVAIRRREAARVKVRLA
jgi:ferrous iron transport protein A